MEEGQARNDAFPYRDGSCLSQRKDLFNSPKALVLRHKPFACGFCSCQEQGGELGLQVVWLLPLPAAEADQGPGKAASPLWDLEAWVLLAPCPEVLMSRGLEILGKAGTDLKRFDVLELLSLSPGATVVTPPARGGTGQRGASCLGVSTIPMWVSPGRCPCESKEEHLCSVTGSCPSGCFSSGLHPCVAGPSFSSGLKHLC